MSCYGLTESAAFWQISELSVHLEPKQISEARTQGGRGRRTPHDSAESGRARAGRRTAAMASIPRKFQKGVDAAKEETEMQQLYTELDAVREQLVLYLPPVSCTQASARLHRACVISAQVQRSR